MQQQGRVGHHNTAPIGPGAQWQVVREVVTITKQTAQEEHSRTEIHESMHNSPEKPGNQHAIVKVNLVHSK